MRTRALATRVPERIAEAIEQLAEAEDMSVSLYLAGIVTAAALGKGGAATATAYAASREARKYAGEIRQRLLRALWREVEALESGRPEAQRDRAVTGD